MNPFGLNIQSIIPLPGCDATGETPDVTIEYGAVPDSLPGAALVRVCSQARPGQFLLTVDHVAKYLVENGCHITIQPAPGVSDDEVRLFLMGSAWSALLLQRGLLPLHGCGLRVKDRAIIFAGPSGNGKSTLAAALMDHGFPLIADELCALVINENSPPLLLPGFPQILLWADSLQILGKKPQHLTPVRPGLEKYILPCCQNSHQDTKTPRHEEKNRFQGLATKIHEGTRRKEGILMFNREDTRSYTKKTLVPWCLGGKNGSFALERIYILTVVNTPSFNITPLKGVSKVHALIDCTYRVHHVAGFGLNVPHFKQCTGAARYIEVKQVKRPDIPFDIECLVKQIEEDF